MVAASLKKEIQHRLSEIQESRLWSDVAIFTFLKYAAVDLHNVRNVSLLNSSLDITDTRSTRWYPFHSIRLGHKVLT